MPRVRLKPSAQEDLIGLAPNEYSAAWGIIDYLSRNPGEGILVSPLQFELDPVLDSPCTVYERSIAPGRVLAVYFEVEAGALTVKRVVPYWRL